MGVGLGYLSGAGAQRWQITELGAQKDPRTDVIAHPCLLLLHEHANQILIPLHILRGQAQAGHDVDPC